MAQTQTRRHPARLLLDRTISVVASVALVGMMFHVIAHGLSRHLFDAPFYGTNEIVAYWYMPVVALLGIIAAQLRGEHITVSILIDTLPTRPRRELIVFGRILGVLVSIGFAWFGLRKAIEHYEIGATAGITTIPMWPINFLVPVVFVILAVLYATAPIKKQNVAAQAGLPEGQFPPAVTPTPVD